MIPPAVINDSLLTERGYFMQEIPRRILQLEDPVLTKKSVFVTGKGMHQGFPES